MLRAALDIIGKRGGDPLLKERLETIKRDPLEGAMLNGLFHAPRANAALPFVKMFYGDPSEYLWYDGEGRARTIRQAEGGEQGRQEKKGNPPAKSMVPSFSTSRFSTKRIRNASRLTSGQRLSVGAMTI